ncbi:MAG: GNAT family N-acetyltransferase [Clostridia bacterium]|nr:GNAT family N-acetyltransferase [Clostridia bacterium]
MIIRKAVAADIPFIGAIYEGIHTAEEAGQASIGWARGVYPTEATAQAALERGDLFVQENEGEIVGAAIINQIQVDVYAGAAWRYPAEDDEIMVLHTLTIAPHAARKGYGRAFVAFYEEYARKHGCRYLRMDTNERNARARTMYRALGYEEIGIAPTVFNSIPGVNLVLLEKKLEDETHDE